VTSKSRIRVWLYTVQPFVGRGLAAVLSSRPEFELAVCVGDHERALESLRQSSPDVAIAYLTSGISLAELRELRAANTRAPLMLWGEGLGGEFVFQAMQLGIRGVLPGSTSIEDLLSALERAHRGELCFETSVMESMLLQKRVVLSPRETQIVSLVAQGLKNKEIAYTLGLSEGTVKVYLSRIFRKLDMNDRLDLALYGLKNLFAGQAGLDRSGEAVQGLACPRSLPLRTRPGGGVAGLTH
jgi:two-component system, NarL family, nitrate/nitrite response regulator NarL